MNHNKEIYFHVGLAKTATTFLQYQVFPEFENVEYLQRTKYRKFKENIDNTNSDKVFISNEFDCQLEREVDKFSQYYPQTKSIIVLRRHDKWMASQYRRAVKNGNTHLFTDFIDLDNDEGDWKQKNTYFYPKIKHLEEKFDHKPLVVFFEDLKKDVFAFIDQFADYMEADYDPQQIDTTPKHKSYNEKQLKVIRKLDQTVFNSEVDYSDVYLIRKLQRWKKMLPRYFVLYSSLLIPEHWIDEQPLIPDEELQRVREFYAEDWKKCREYAAKNNQV